MTNYDNKPGGLDGPPEDDDAHIDWANRLGQGCAILVCLLFIAVVVSGLALALVKIVQAF